MRRSLVIAVSAFAVIAASTASCKSGCAKDDASARGVSDGAPRIELAFAGCAAVRRSESGDALTCELAEPRVVRVWIPSALKPRVSVAEQATESVDGGDLHRLQVAENETSVAIALDDAGVTKQWTLAIAKPAAPPEAVDEARKARAAGDFARATTLLRDALASAPEREQAVVRSALARTQLAAGDADAAKASFERAMSEHRAAGRISAAVDDAFALAYVLLEQRAFTAAREIIERGESWTAGYHEGLVMARYHRGFRARDTGDLRGALTALEEADALARRTASQRLARMATIEIAITLDAMGRTPEALALLQELEARTRATIAPCDRADLLLEIGWLAYLARDGAEREADAPSDPRPPLEEGRAIVRDTCGDKRSEANAVTSLAFVSLAMGDVARARAEVAEAKRVLPQASDAIIAFAWVELEARIALRDGNARAALASFDRLAELATAAGSPADEWRAADGRASALAAMNKKGDALAAAEQAERLADAESRSVPLGEGRGRFLAARDRATQRQVELLVDAGKPALAIAAVRRARARVAIEAQRADRIAALDPGTRARWDEALAEYRAARDALAREATNDWSLSADALAKAIAARRERETALHASLERAMTALPRGNSHEASLPQAGSGTVLVVLAPLDRGVVVLVADGKQVTAQRLPSDDSPALAKALAKVTAAQRVQIVASGRLARVDVHALVIGGEPLVARAAVEYPLDVAPLAVDAGAASGGALVVGDPRSDLPSARAEARAVAESLRASGAALLLEGASATRESVQASLTTAHLLHYAGHGTFRGHDGWQSALPLGGSTELAVPDILALAHVPRDIVLSGCDTAGASSDREPPAFGIAQAFLAAGAARVIAATRKVDDASTASLMIALHRALAAHRGPEPMDLSSALREAQLAERARGSDAWTAWRALVR